MPSSTAKRVLLYRFDRQPLEAIVNPAGYLGTSQIELITVGGNLQRVPYADVKAVCFASEPGHGDLFTAHNFFERRPKVPGLWTRFTFRDGDKLDGILSHNLLDWPDPGYLITPAGAGAGRQRVFIPRLALSRTELLGVVGASTVAGSSRKKGAKAEDRGQLRMFDG